MAGMVSRLWAAPPTFAPEWTWEPAAGVEWVTQARCGGSELLVNTRDGKLYLLDLDSGKELLDGPIQARPGLRPVDAAAVGTNARAINSLGPAHPAEPEYLAYCYDRFTVLAVRVRPEAGLAWRVGTWREGLAEPAPPGADPANTFQGDPEELRQLLAAGATSRGVILVRDDGTLGLLGRDDGRVLWQHRVAPAAMARVHVRAGEAAVVSRSGPEVQAVCVDIETGRLREYPLMPERPWPLWSGLSSGGLALIEPERCVIANSNDARSVFRSTGGAKIISASVALATETDSTPDSQPDLLVFGTSDGVLHAISPRDGSERWTCPDRDSGGGLWSWVKLVGDVVVSAVGQTAHVRDARTGRLLAKFEAAPGGRLLDASVVVDQVWVLMEAPGGSNGAEYQLVAVECCRASTQPATEKQSVSNLGRAGVFLSAAWAERHLVVCTRGGLSVYLIP